MIYGKREKLCDICIITFSQNVIEYALQKCDCKKVALIESTGGAIPIYTMTYQGKKLALYQSIIGAPAAGACLEEAHCLTGASHYIMFGSCGCLHPEITAGKLIVSTQAYRDEGLSYHYAPAGDYLPLPNAGRVASFFLSRRASRSSPEKPGRRMGCTAKRAPTWRSEKRRAA